MVIKEEKPTWTQWYHEFRKEVPNEVQVMAKLNKISCYAIPRLYKYKRYNRERKHRIYMEFCRQKDLAVLAGRYKNFR